MLTQLALLPVLAVTVTGVTSEAHDNDVTIEVATSEPIAPSRVRPMAGTRLLYVFVNDATPDRAVFGNGSHAVAARARTQYTKLEIPLDPGQRCYEPADVKATPSGLRIQFACSATAGAAAPAARQEETPAPAERREVRAAGLTASQELLKAALALPADMPFAAKADETDESPAAESEDSEPAKASAEGAAQPSPQAKAPGTAVDPPASGAAAGPPAPGRAAQAPTLAVDETIKPTAEKNQAAARVKSVPPATVALATSAPAPLPPAPASALASAGRGGSWFVLAVVILVGVAGGVLAFTRRRARREGLIHILETAAIGPKRTLLVARVNGQTMVLGASEAGIALLASVEGKSDTPVAAVMGNLPPVREPSEESAVAAAGEPAPEPEGEIGVLSRLFRRRPKLATARDEAAFRELLEESYEDQELRDKLAQGLTAKVS